MKRKMNEFNKQKMVGMMWRFQHEAQGTASFDIGEAPFHASRGAKVGQLVLYP